MKPYKPYKITMELNLEKIIAESREVAQALNEFADELKRIGNKYGTETEAEIWAEKIKKDMAEGNGEV